jgi:hypothetical protein
MASDTEQAPPPSLDPAKMSDRELLLFILGRVDALMGEVTEIKKRLQEGDKRFEKIEESIRAMNLVPMLRYLELAHERLNNPAVATEIREHIEAIAAAEPRPVPVDREEKTDPGYRPPPS